MRHRPVHWRAPRAGTLRRRSLATLATVAISVLLAACTSSSSPQAASTSSTTGAPSATLPPTTAAKHHPSTTTTTTTTVVTSSGPPTTWGQAPARSCSTPPLRRPASGLVLGRVTAVGDSVMIDLEPYLTSDVKRISFDAVVGQQWSTGISDVQQLRSDGRLGSIVIIELGTNGPITAELFSEMMQALKGVSRVVFVTNYVPDSYETSNNSIIEQGVTHYDNAAVANWYALASAHPGWLCPDGYHLSCGGPGAAAMAALISRCA